MIPEKQQQQNKYALPKGMTKARSGMSYSQLKANEKYSEARPFTPSVPAKIPRDSKSYSKPWLVNAAAESIDS